MVSKPSLSSVQVRLLPSPSAPQVPLATTSAASAVAGRSDAIISTASTKLKSLFLICYPPYFLTIFAHFAAHAASRIYNNTAKIYPNPIDTISQA